MKKLSIFALSAFLLAVSCKESKTDNATTSAEQQGDILTVNTDNSSVNFDIFFGILHNFGLAFLKNKDL